MFRIYYYDDFLDLEIFQNLYRETEEEIIALVDELRKDFESENFYYVEV